MAADQLFPTLSVARALRVDGQSILNWKNQGRLIPDDVDSRGHYFFTARTIDTFICANAHGFCRMAVPKFVDLLYGRESLLISDEVADQLGIKPRTANERARVGILPMLKLSKRVNRFPARHIARIASTAQDAVVTHMAAHILGVARKTVTEDLIPAGRLKYAKVSDGPFAYVTRDSLFAYLTDQLAECGMPPHAWWQERVLHPEPLVTMQQAKKRLHTDAPKIIELMEDGRLPSIRTLGGVRLVPEHRVAAYEAWRVALTNAQIAHLFAVDEATAARWRDVKALCKVKHSEFQRCPRKACVLDYVRTHSIGVNAEEWWYERFHGDQTPLSFDEVVDRFAGIDPKTILEYIKNGTFRSIVLPYQWGAKRDYRILPSEVRVLQRLHEHRLSGGDYHVHLDEVSGQ